MSVRTKEELLTAFNTIAGENSNDDVLNFLDDLSDTIDTYADSANQITELKNQLEQTDRAWREKYRARFFETKVENPEVDTEKTDDGEKEEVSNFEDLFKEEK